MNKIILIEVILAALYFSTAPASAAVDEDLQLWTPITLDFPLRKKLHAYLEAAPRIGNGVGRLNQLLVRPALQYKINDKFSLLAGYLWQTTYNTQVLHEHRVWQQVLFDKDVKRLSLINRTRLEQRMFSDLGGVGNRLRHMIKGDYDLSKTVYLVSSNELFLNLNSLKGGPQQGVDQNRFFVGLGLKSFKGSRLEAGYQYQYVNRSDEFDDQANHAILIQTFIGILD